MCRSNGFVWQGKRRFLYTGGNGVALRWQFMKKKGELKYLASMSNNLSTIAAGKIDGWKGGGATDVTTLAQPHLAHAGTCDVATSGPVERSNPSTRAKPAGKFDKVWRISSQAI